MNNEYTNHLILEKSPYLLQHAHNPVDWYAWGDEAFKKAKSQNKPIFLSIGYSTCHWCHVMEHESFEDSEVAELLNKSFISIKVDREERPDVDAVYMAVCQSMTGQGGWPLTIVMTPDQKPFYAGTYLPKTSKYKMIGVTELLSNIILLWETDTDKLLKSADEITDFIKIQAEKEEKPSDPSIDIFKKALTLYEQSFDDLYGGFNKAPKFPTPHNIMFLLRYYSLTKNKSALKMAEKTLIQMYRGGIFDHIGGGFSRYSTDNKWLVPHFEKMLYDNALLVNAYLDAYVLTNNTLYEMILRKILNYVFAELCHEDGGFFCGQDADSDGIEGKYYVFSPEEIKEVLGELDGENFCKCFDITSQGNFEGNSIPNLLKNDNFSNLDNTIKPLCDKLYEYRLGRTHLHKDDKILVSWNGLMIRSLAKSYSVFKDVSYLQAAIKANNFIENNLINKDGQLLVRWRDSNAAGEGKIDDYAFYASALIELYNSTFDLNFLNKAISISKIMVDKFFDFDNGGFFLYSNVGEKLISRPKELYDGAIPSGNSVATLVLGQLFTLTGEIYWQELSEKQLRFTAGNISQYYAAYSFSLIAMSHDLYPSQNLICVTSQESSIDELTEFLNTKRNLHISVLIKTDYNSDELARIAPFTGSYPVPTNGVAYYLCKNGACLAPIYSLDELKTIINS